MEQEISSEQEMSGDEHMYNVLTSFETYTKYKQCEELTNEKTELLRNTLMYNILTMLDRDRKYS